MRQQIPRKTLLSVTALHTIELITLLCLLHWTMHFFWTPIRSSSLTFAEGRLSELAAEPDYRQEVWAIALALSGLLYLPMKSLATITEKELLSLPLSTEGLKRLLALLLLALAQLAVLVVAHRMTI